MEDLTSISRSLREILNSSSAYIWLDCHEAMAVNLALTAEEQRTLTEVVQKYLESDDTGVQRAACEVILELLEEGDEETRAQRRVSHKIIGGGGVSIAHVRLIDALIRR